MAWVKLDDGFFSNPKIISVSQAAKLIYVAGLCYAGANLTDGVIPRGAVRLLAAQSDIHDVNDAITELLAIGLWYEHERGYEIHDYLDHNTSANEVRTKREQARVRSEERRKKFAESSQEVRANASRSSQEVRMPEDRRQKTEAPNGVNTPKPPHDESGAKAPGVSKPQRYPDHFETFWQDYPSGHGVKKQAFAQWQKIPASERQAVMDGLSAWKASDRWQRGYVKDAQRWLRDRQWEDEPPPPADSTLTVHAGGKNSTDAAFDQVARENGWHTDADTSDAIDTNWRQTS